MPLKIKILISEKLGTHYGVFSGEKLIHIEFCRSAAEKFITATETKKKIFDQPIKEELNKQVSNLANIQRITLESDLADLDNRFSVETLASKHRLSQEEANDLSKLLIDMKPMSFSSSHQLSDYIFKNKLSHQYPNIAGIVKMQKGSDKWDYNGGFSNDIYKIICNELSLLNKGTSARAIGFLSHKDMRVKNNKDK